jgi:hypothetical protein
MRSEKDAGSSCLTKDEEMDVGVERKWINRA